MISGFSFYRSYISVKLHLTTKYDALKYHGKTNTKESDFLKRNDRYAFEKYGNKTRNQDEAIKFCIANFMLNGNDWLHEDATTADLIYKKWDGIQTALTHHITEDLKYIKSIIDSKLKQYDNIFQTTPMGKKAPLLQLYLTQRIVPETILFLNGGGADFINSWLKEYDNDPLVTRELFKLSKYASFTKLNRSKLLPIHSSIFLNNTGEPSGKD